MRIVLFCLLTEIGLGYSSSVIKIQSGYNTLQLMFIILNKVNWIPIKIIFALFLDHTKRECDRQINVYLYIKNRNKI